MSPRPELWGIREVAVYAGVTPQAVSNWRKRYPDFPEPLTELRLGPVWRASDARAWVLRHIRPRQ